MVCCNSSGGRATSYKKTAMLTAMIAHVMTGVRRCGTVSLMGIIRACPGDAEAPSYTPAHIALPCVYERTRGTSARFSRPPLPVVAGRNEALETSFDCRRASADRRSAREACPACAEGDRGAA